MDNRGNEPPQTWFRSGRTFCSDQAWYFHTREGITLGPYRSQLEADLDAGILLARLRDAPAGMAGSIIREFILDTGSTRAGLSDTTFTDYLLKEGLDALKPGTARGGGE